MNNAENTKKYRDIQLVATEGRRNYLVSEPSYHTTKFFTEYLLPTELEKTQIFMNKNVFQYQNYLFSKLFELDRPLTKGKTKKVIGLLKDKLGEKIMKNVLAQQNSKILQLLNRLWQ